MGSDRAQLTYFVSLIFLCMFLLSIHAVAWADEKEVSWSQLSEAQKKVLQPLASEWDTLRPWQKEKMLDIAKDYPKMGNDKQALVQQRLTNWSRMTPYERDNARKKHQQFNALSPEKKMELRKKWNEYDSLPESERARLRAESPDTYTDADLN